MTEMDKKPQSDMLRKRRRRNVALACAIFATAILFYVMSIVRMSAGSGS